MDSFLSNWLELMMHEGKPISRKIYKTCTKCHLSWEEFRKTGKVGCAECYRSFQPEILSVIQQIQGTSIHVGKAPEKSTEEIAKNKKMKNLRKKLQVAIEKEEFEKAANLRDQIRTISDERGESDEN